MKFADINTYVYISKYIDHQYCQNRNLNVGDRGRILAKTKYDEENYQYLIEFDRNIGGHDGNKRGKYGYCWWIHGEYLSFHKECSPVYIDGLI